MTAKHPLRPAEPQRRRLVAIEGGGSDITVAALGTIVAGIGVTRTVVGLGAWLAVRSQLAAERIVVPPGADRLGGRPVKGPFTAYEEADFIKRLALEATGGKTYGELEETDPAAATAMNASLLRSSLFTSVLAFGVAAAEMASGAVLIVAGIALRRIARRLPLPAG